MINRVAIIGAGTMGVGVCVDVCLHQLDVVLVDNMPSKIEAAKKDVAKSVRFASFLNPKIPKQPLAQVMERVQFTTDLEQVADCDFVVENVPEKWEIKEAVYKQLEEICPSHVCFGVNTSCLSITRIGAVTRRQDQVVGIHFMNPVIAKPVVEVMRGSYTSEETLSTCRQFLAQLDKEPVVVGDMAGFVSNRISHLFMNEAMWVVQDGVASAEQVDKIFKACFGHTMGPLETADLIGLDVVMDSLSVLYESFQDPKFRCCPLLRQMVDAGKTGRKQGRGFFDYPHA